MARTVTYRKSNRPLKIVNKFSGEDGSSFMDKFNDFQFSDKGQGVLNGLRGFNAATAKMDGQQPSMLSLDGFDYSQSGKAGGVFQAVDETAQALQGISNLTKKKRKPLSEVVGLAYGGRLYGLGGDVIGNAIKGTTGLVGNAIQQASITDTSDLRKGIQQRGNVKIKASNYDDLQNAWSQRSNMNHIKASDLRSNSVFDDIMNSFSASAQGAGLGSMFKDGGYIPIYSYYPNNQYAIGGIIGGVAGGLSSVIGSIVGRVRANKEAKKVNQLVDAMNNRNYMSYVNNANNIDTQNDLNAMANYAALGGMLDYLSPLYQTGDSLQYDYLQNRNNLLQAKINNDSSKSKDDELINSYASGGGIHINPKNKGKLTATAKRTGKSFSELAHSKNPLTRKRAQFALNARHFNHKHKHALGGDLQSNGADWDLGFTTIGNGGTHEMNPNEGVQMGVDNQGIPNLVEQGEVIYNNYVFSNRLPLDKETAIQFNLPASFAGMTFAKASEKASKEINERPNDPITRRGLDATMQKLQSAQEYVRQQQQADRTKEMINNMSPEELQGLMAMANQGMQQQAQDQAMQEQAAQEQMMAQQGIDPNALGAGALYGAYGGRLGRMYGGWGEFMQLLQKYDPQSHSLLDSYLLKNGNGEYIIDQNGNYMFDPNKENIPASNLDYYIQNWWNNRGDLYTGKKSDLPDSVRNIIGDSNPIYNKQDNPYNFKGSPLEYLRFAGIIPQLLINAPLAFSKANYENSDKIEAAAYNTGYAPIQYEPLGNYLQYTPEDISLPLAANAQAKAREQAILRNASNGNRGALAAYLANSNYNAQLANSQLFRDAVKQNQEEKEKVARFNRETNQTNADNALKAAMQNQDARMKGSAQTMNALIAAANMRQDIADTKTQARSDFANGLAAYLAGIGEDYFNRNTVQGMRSTYYSRGNRGSSKYKGLDPDYNSWWPNNNYSSKNLIPSTKEQAEWLIQDALDPFGYRNKASYGGKINAKKRRVKRRKYA